jgi:hypothetical protein
MKQTITEEKQRFLVFVYYCRGCGKEFRVTDNDELVSCPECDSIDCEMFSIENI